jgi:hypothetical protein
VVERIQGELGSPCSPPFLHTRQASASARSRVACAIASATPSAPLMPPGRRRTIPGTCEGTETPGWPPTTLIVSGEWLHVIRSWPRRLWRRSCRGHCVRPGRDQARPAGPRAVSWFRSRPGDDRASDGCARQRSRRLDQRRENPHRSPEKRKSSPFREPKHALIRVSLRRDSAPEATIPGHRWGRSPRRGEWPRWAAHAEHGGHAGTASSPDTTPGRWAS